jgi:hypothetical protein
VLIAIGIVASGRDDLLALPESLQFGGWLGFLLMLGLMWILYRTGTSVSTQSAPPGQPAAARE